MANSKETERKMEALPVQPAATGRRMYRRRGDLRPPEGNAFAWLLTFTDTMALMLTFFVLLFSMTEPEKQNWSEVTSALQSEFNKFYGALQNRGPLDALNIDRINFNQALNIGYLKSLLESAIGESKFLEGVTLIPQPGSLIISLPRDLLFDSGDAAVTEEGARALYVLGGVLSKIRNKIEVAGHADPRPVDGNAGQFDSNWDLSLMRAANVAAILESVGYDKDIVIHGHSSGRYADLQSIVDEQLRLDLARRVDIIVMDHDGSKQKVFFDPEFE